EFDDFHAHFENRPVIFPVHYFAGEFSPASKSVIIEVARQLPGRSSICRGPHNLRRGGRVAEGGGLLNRYRVKSSIGGSNPPLSARITRLPACKLSNHRCAIMPFTSAMNCYLDRLAQTHESTPYRITLTSHR